MKVYTVGVIGCGRIASLLEQETHRGNPNTHGGCYDYYHRTRIVAADDMSDPVSYTHLTLPTKCSE